MFQAVINKQTTELEGTEGDLLKGLCCYIVALNKAGVSIDTIENTCNLAISRIKEKSLEERNNRVKTVTEEKDFTVHEINIEGLSKQEATDLLRKILSGGKENGRNRML